MVAAVVGVLLVTWAATIGPSAVLARGRLRSSSESRRRPPSASDVPTADGQTDPREEAAESDGSAAGDLFVNVLTVIFLVGCAVVAGRLLGFAGSLGCGPVRRQGASAAARPIPRTSSST